jgi:predicted transcriptional regulator
MDSRSPRLTPLERRVMQALWAGGDLSVREIQVTFPERRRPAYTTVQTIVYRLERKGALRRIKKVGNAFVFAATLTRDAVSRGVIDDLLRFFGGHSRPVLAHLIEAGKLTLDDVRDAEQTLKRLARERGRKP